MVHVWQVFTSCNWDLTMSHYFPNKTWLASIGGSFLLMELEEKPCIATKGGTYTAHWVCFTCILNMNEMY